MNAPSKLADEQAKEIIRHPEIAKPLTVITPDTSAPHRPVIAAIARVMAQVGAVEKRGRNDFHRYDYATAADIANALQRLMADNGLVIVQHEVPDGLAYHDNGSVLVVRYEFTVIHSSGDALAPVLHTGMSAARNSKGGYDDKAANKCHTAARKYFLLSLFSIPTGDYPDADGQEDQPAPKLTKRKADQPKQEEPPAEEPKPFEIVNGWGEVLRYARGGEYLAGIELAFSEAPDKAGFWESNQEHFAQWQARVQGKPGGTEFNRVGQAITAALASKDAA